ncbi:hypothetical protein PHMEG_00014647 [Phytophthora megakarya]|uniref:Uncharacterized protein n=1 Tax=Phytophthora megakarya TaxID=4795 RepID=A0A225W4U6_9STRA|nr:hypothetical protein PHMEG_00014647 [Phytophthora megakarya]
MDTIQKRIGMAEMKLWLVRYYVTKNSDETVVGSWTIRVKEN